MFKLSSRLALVAGLRWFVLTLILVISILAAVIYLPEITGTLSTTEPEPYFGVSFNGNTIEQAKMLIDKIKGYTNIFVLQSGPISKNETATNIICDYAVDAGLDFIVFFGWFDPAAPWQIPWLDYATSRWGVHFLGIYFFDESGGIQIDHEWEFNFHHIKEVDPEFYQDIKAYIEGDSGQVVRDYELVKNNYIEYLQNHVQLDILNKKSIPAFTADYALYWFDYLAGYDTVFVELGWNHDIQKHIALCRGAATVQQKDWGTIIVWNSINRDNEETGTYKSGPEMLSDMLISYEAGSKYIIIFNYPQLEDNQYGILTDEHFGAMEQFWNYMEKNPDEYGKTETQAALVLPENYGWGMRTIDDKIWGYWGPDEKSEQIWNISQQLLTKYGLALDIVYEDTNYPLINIYTEIIYWNSTD
jgi:hypothetical protein